MSSGLPDYYRGIDVAYQALAQMVVRPKYGGAKVIDGHKEVVGNVVTNLCSVTGKGMVYGGAVWLDYTLTQSNSIVHLVTDMQALSNISFVRMNEYGINNPRSSVVTLNRYDEENHIYSVGISYGVTFENAVALAYSEEYGYTPMVHYTLSYALL